MTYGNTDLIKALVSDSSITDVFRKELEKTINLLLETELTEFLSYEKYAVEGYNTGNSRNGYYVRHLKTQFG
ncbi:IS256 family transposase, partial [Veillonella sp. R32]